MKKSKQPQIRRCAVCNKIGHNKSTCSQIATNESAPNIEEKVAANSYRPLRFFVHHIQSNSSSSPHVVNLKNSHTDIWHNVNASSPETDTSNNSYYFHQPIPKKPLLVSLPPKKLPQINSDKLPYLSFKINRKNVSTQSDTNFSLHKNFSRNTNDVKEVLTDEQSLICDIKTDYSHELKSHVCDPIPTSTKHENLPKKSDVKKANKQYFKRFAVSAGAKLSARRVVAVIVLFALLAIAPTQAQNYYFNLKISAADIASDGMDGFNDLQESTAAIMAGDISQAQGTLRDALHNFNSALDALDSNYYWLINAASAVPIIGKEVQSRQKILTAGHALSLGNTYLLRGIENAQYSASSTLTDKISTVLYYLDLSIPQYEKALSDLSFVDSSALPNQYQSAYISFKTLFTTFVNDLKNISALGKSTEEIFGGQGLRRYLLIFQNPNEIRATGGFMGSFAVLDVRDGKIINLDVPAGGSYDLQGQLDSQVEPPSPLLLVSKRWEFQDANWFPDFPASAKKIMWFYRHSRNVSADGVIAINANVLSRLLSIIGPVKDDKRQLTLTADNALSTIQNIVENGPEKQQFKPKQIISDLTDELVAYFDTIKPREVMPLLSNLLDAFKQKEIQGYFVANEAQNTMNDFGWSGRILPTREDQDYLFVVNTNIRGEKSDAMIKQKISHQASVQDDGTIIDNVVIERTHEGQSGEKLYGTANVDYIRIYVPKGSQLISASGFTWPDESDFRAPAKNSVKDKTLDDLEKEIKIDTISGTRITNEFDKTAFGNWVATEAGQTSQIQFTYTLPFKATSKNANSNLTDKFNKLFGKDTISTEYQLVTQKQSGISSSFETQIIYGSGWLPSWEEESELSLAANGAYLKPIILNEDRYFKVKMNKAVE